MLYNTLITTSRGRFKSRLLGRDIFCNAYLCLCQITMTLVAIGFGHFCEFFVNMLRVAVEGKPWKENDRQSSEHVPRGASCRMPGQLQRVAGL